VILLKSIINNKELYKNAINPKIPQAMPTKLDENSVKASFKEFGFDIATTKKERKKLEQT
jgi:hypothetical protein